MQNNRSEYHSLSLPGKRRSRWIYNPPSLPESTVFSCSPSRHHNSESQGVQSIVDDQTSTQVELRSSLAPRCHQLLVTDSALNHNLQLIPLYKSYLTRFEPSTGILDRITSIVDPPSTKLHRPSSPALNTLGFRQYSRLVGEVYPLLDLRQVDLINCNQALATFPLRI